MTYRITEPHPSVPRTRYLSGGRGGAGNFTHVADPKSITDGPTASGPASRALLTPPPSHAFFHSGRGGSGNAHREHERAMFSFDEELAQQRRVLERGAAPVYHIGRGGAGNAVDELKPGSGVAPRRNGSTSSEASTAGSTAGTEGQRGSLESAWQRVSRTFSRS